MQFTNSAFLVALLLANMSCMIHTMSYNGAQYACECNQASCYKNWNYANRGSGCVQSDGWPWMVCGGGRGWTWIGFPYWIWEKKIDCEVCPPDRPRTLIWPSFNNVGPQYQCLTPPPPPSVTCTSSSSYCSRAASSFDSSCTCCAGEYRGQDPNFWFYSCELCTPGTYQSTDYHQAAACTQLP